MRIFLVSFVSSLFLLSFNQLHEVKIPALKVSFQPISTTKLNPQTDEEVESWETNNTCIFETDSKKSTLSYKELDKNNSIVKSYSYPVVNYFHDETIHKFAVKTNDGVANYMVWKNKSMVVIQTSEWNYLITKP